MRASCILSCQLPLQKKVAESLTMTMAFFHVSFLYKRLTREGYFVNYEPASEQIQQVHLSKSSSLQSSEVQCLSQWRKE